MYNIISSNIARNIKKWEGHSERILTMEFTLNREISKVITVYGPNEVEKTEQEDDF